MPRERLAGKPGAVDDIHSFLCVRFDLRVGMVPVPPASEKPMLHYLPDFQLGSSDDVYSHDLGGKLFLLEPAAGIPCGVDHVGTKNLHASGTLLVSFQRGA